MIAKIIRKLNGNNRFRAFVARLGLSQKTIARLQELIKPSKSKSRRLKDVEKRVEDLNFKLDLLLDYYTDVSKARPATGVRYQKQQCMLKLLKEFNRICRKYSIPYWLDYGTLLGAKRHKGFIPWDGDADVSMMYEDSKKYAEVFKKELPEGMEFVLLENGTYAQIRGLGVYLDVYGYEDLGDRIKSKVITFLFPSVRLSIPKTAIFPLSEIEFEGEFFCAPADADAYLRCRYGHYEVLPKKAHAWEHPEWERSIPFYPEEV